MPAINPPPIPPRMPTTSTPPRPAAITGNYIADIQRRIREIENEFRNPQMRDIYRNNRIYMPNGDRVLPGHNNRVELSSDPTFTPPIRARPGEPTENCIICMEDIPISHMIKLECQHSFCRICVKDQLLAALGNVTDSIPLKCPNSATGCTHIITHDSPHVKKAGMWIKKAFTF